MSYIIPVIFRVDREGDVLAIFPTLPANRNRKLCYAHIGQHSECSDDYWQELETANFGQYSPLLSELRQIYDDCELVVRND